jgi:hypothetical protein
MRVHEDSGSDSSVVLINERTGVMPEPAAMATRCPADPGSGSMVNSPTGGITSITSPAFRRSIAQFEKTPPGSRFTPTLSFPSLALEQIE